jgi:hypothetical protein
VSGIDTFLASIEEHFKESERKSHPDYRNTVFCDKHLGVKMLLARSHGLIESGPASADVNPLDHWRCPKAECIRCYEPTMFGYYWDSVEMGSRKMHDSTRQPRCGAHPGTPFMYVAKVGQGRRYLCPFYKCDKQGDEIGSVVIDEEVEIPRDPWIDLKKADREMAVFKSFVASGVAIDKGSESNAEPPYPDVRCTISGKLHWFELGQIIDKEVAAKTSPRRNRMDGGFGFSQETPFVYIVKDKATKTYETLGAPVDLVLHFDLHLGTKRVIQDQIQKHAALLKTLVNEGPFSRVWIYDEYTKSIVWSDVRS